jgi:hypothetical protein
LNAVFATLLATALAILVNVGGARLYVRWPVARHLYGALSDRTLQLLRNTEGDIQLIAFFEHRHPLAPPVRALLQEFSEAARTIPNLRVRTVSIDPNRDVVEAGEVARAFAAPPNSLVVRARNNFRLLETADLLGSASGVQLEEGVRDFMGEAAVASAIWNATRAYRPVVYFLTGNGEHDPFEYDTLTGYSTAARYLQQDGFALRSLSLSNGTGIPDDCALLVVAGPRTEIGHHAAELVGTYLTTGGRLLLLLDSVADAGLRGILEEWGIRAFGPLRRPGAHSGIETSDNYGDHPVTHGLSRVETVFQTPCRFAIRPEAMNVGHADKPRASPLVSLGPVPATVTEPDAAAEEAAATALAVAAERGVKGAQEGASLARLVVVGDAQFAANAALNGGYDGNRDFFLSAVDWLTEQEVLIGRMPVTFRVLRSGIPADGWWRAAFLVVFLWPGSVWLIGMVLTYRRRAARRG